MTDEITTETDVNVRSVGQTRRRLITFVLSVLGIALGPLLEPFLSRPFAVAVLLLALSLFIVSVLGLIGLDRFRREDVTVGRDGARLGARTIPIASIKAADFAPRVGRARAMVRLFGARHETLARIVVDNQAAGERMLEALRLGPSERAVRYQGLAPIWSPAWLASMTGLFAGLLAVGVAVPLQAPPLLLVAFVLILAGALLLLADVHIGADGVLIDSRIQPKFVAWSEVDAIHRYDGGMTLIRRDMPPVKIPLGGGRNQQRDIERARQEACVLRATRALEAYRSGAKPDVASILARRGRSHEEWIKALYAREGTFRTAPILDEQLWSVVESPVAEASARGGAAAMLSREAGEIERTRLRVAAEGCSEPRLRVVLEEAARGASTREIEGALRGLEADEPASSRRARARH